MQRKEFLFTIGYEGSTAVIDRRRARQYGKLGTMELARAGLYETAFRSALYNQNDDEMNELLAYLREHTALPADNADSLKRLFGVYGVPPQVRRTLSV